MDRYAQSVALEKEYVHDVYDHIAPHFSNKHFKAWPKVRQFLEDLPPGAVVADIGCGNGRYFGINASTFMIGCDCCAALINIAKQHQGQGQSEVMVCDNLQLPYRDACCDAVISIGVIHHFSTVERRIRAVREIARLLRPGGKVMIYVWALEQKQRKFEAQDVLVPYHMQSKPTKKKERRLHLIERELSSASSISEDDSYLELTVPRTPSTPLSASPRATNKNGRSHFNWDVVDSGVLPLNKSQSELLEHNRIITNGTNCNKSDENSKPIRTADTDSDSPEYCASPLSMINCHKAKGLSLSSSASQSQVLTSLKPKTSQMFKVPDYADSIVSELPVTKIHLICSPKLMMRKHCLSSQGSSISSMEDEDAEDDCLRMAGPAANKATSESADHFSKKKIFRKHTHTSHKPETLVTSKKTKHHHKHPHLHHSSSHRDTATEDTDSDSPFSNISRFLKSSFPTIFTSSTAKVTKLPSPLEKDGLFVESKDDLYKDLIGKAMYSLPSENDYPVIEGFEVREFPQSSRKETFNEGDCKNGACVTNGAENGNLLDDWSKETDGKLLSDSKKVNGYHEDIHKNINDFENGLNELEINSNYDYNQSEMKTKNKDLLEINGQSGKPFSSESGSSFSKEFIELYMQYVDIGDTDIIQAAEFNNKKRSQVDNKHTNPSSHTVKGKSLDLDLKARQRIRCHSTSSIECKSKKREQQTIKTSDSPLIKQNGELCHVTNGNGASTAEPQYQRYYHVFKKKELVQLIQNHEPSLRIVQSCYDHANWCVVAEKI